MDDNQQRLPPNDTSDPKSPASDPLISGETRRNSKGQFGPGNGANNSGRPPKICNQSSVLVTSLLEESVHEITQAAIAEAKKGNALAIEPLPLRHASRNSRACDADRVNSSN